MRKPIAARNLIAVPLVVAGALAAWAVAQDRGTRDRAPAGAPPEQRGPEAPPEVEGPGTELEWTLMRPGRVVVRDAWDVGRVEGRPVDAGGEIEGVVRVTAIVAHEPDNAAAKVGGVELVLGGGPDERTFFFDARQVPDLIAAFHNVTDAADKQRDPPQGARRRLVFTMNGLEIGMQLRRQGAYLASVDPDDLSVGLGPNDFESVRRLLEDARDVLNRELRTRPGAGRDARDPEAGGRGARPRGGTAVPAGDSGDAGEPGDAEPRDGDARDAGSRRDASDAAPGDAADRQ